MMVVLLLVMLKMDILVWVVHLFAKESLLLLYVVIIKLKDNKHVMMAIKIMVMDVPVYAGLKMIGNARVFLLFVSLNKYLIMVYL